MKVNLNLCCSQAINSKTNRQNKAGFNNLNFMGTPRVKKDIGRFLEFNNNKLPATVKAFLDGAENIYRYTPLEVQQAAFIKLVQAKNVQDVRELFPLEKDELFKDLKDYKKTKASIGLLAIYREFKDIYPNGILKNGEDLSIYLLKKIFLEAKTLDGINADLDNDLIPEVREEYRRRKPDGIYIRKDTLQALGIKRPDVGYQNSLRHTNEEFSKNFSESCSLAQTIRWSLVPQEERSEKTAHLRDYYANLPQEKKDAVNVERAKNLAIIWRDLSQEDRDDLIEKIKERQETFRYALFYTWNHSLELIRELSKFLAAKQILKPVDVLFADDEFREFQSKIMKEFWGNHGELAEQFGRTLSDAIARVEKSIENGTFEDFKRDIMFEREERIKLLNSEKLATEQKTKETSHQNTEKQNIISKNYKESFKIAYNEYLNKDKILPTSYVKEITDIIIENLPANEVIKVTEKCKKGIMKAEELTKTFLGIGDVQNYKKIIKMQRALETAIARELYSKTNNPEVFAMEHDDIINFYRQKMHENTPWNQYPVLAKIYEYYDENLSDLTEKKLNNIAKRYFTYKNDEVEKAIADYIKLYGKAALILFSDDNSFSNDVKIKFNEKFLKHIPENIKQVCRPVFNSPEEIIAEPFIKQIKETIRQRFDFMPKDFIHAYTNEVMYTIHLYNFAFKEPTNNIYSIKSFEENVCQRKSDGENRMKFIKIPKVSLQNENKIKILAGEQALADELYRITGNESVYGLEVEVLMSFFEQFSRYDDTEVLDDEGNVEFEVKAKPNKYYINRKYQEYLDELNQRASDIFDEDYNIKDKEELLYALNPLIDNEQRDELIRKRLEVYTEELSGEPIQFTKNV